jgi:hypothetical protein
MSNKRILYHYDGQDRTISCWVNYHLHENNPMLNISGYTEDQQAKKDNNRFLFNLWVEKEHLEKLYRIMHIPVGSCQELCETIATAFQGRQAYFEFQKFLHRECISFFGASNWYWGEEMTESTPKRRNTVSKKLFDYEVSGYCQVAECHIDDDLHVHGCDCSINGEEVWFSFMLEVEYKQLLKLYKVLSVPRGCKEQLADALVQRFDRTNGWYHLQNFLLRHNIAHGVYCAVVNKGKEELSHQDLEQHTITVD